MNIFEFRVLQAANVATARYQRPGHDFEATSGQIAYVLRTEFAAGWARNGRNVGPSLCFMADGYPRRREALVEKIPGRPNRWRLTRAGASVLCA